MNTSLDRATKEPSAASMRREQGPNYPCQRTPQSHPPSNKVGPLTECVAPHVNIRAVRRTNSGRDQDHPHLHSQKEEGWKCTSCGRTWSARCCSAETATHGKPRGPSAAWQLLARPPNAGEVAWRACASSKARVPGHQYVSPFLRSKSGSPTGQKGSCQHRTGSRTPSTLSAPST